MGHNSLDWNPNNTSYSSQRSRDQTRLHCIYLQNFLFPSHCLPLPPEMVMGKSVLMVMAAGGEKLNCLAELAQGDLQAQKALKIAILFIVLIAKKNSSSLAPTYRAVNDDGALKAAARPTILPHRRLYADRPDPIVFMLSHASLCEHFGSMATKWKKTPETKASSRIWKWNTFVFHFSYCPWKKRKNFMRLNDVRNLCTSHTS